MKFDHIVVLLKADSQIEKALKNMNKWQELNKKIGKWKKDYPQEAKLLFSIIWGRNAEGSGLNKRLPILCSKENVDVINPHNREGLTRNFEESFQAIPTLIGKFTLQKRKIEEVETIYRQWANLINIQKNLLTNEHAMKTKSDVVESFTLLKEYNDMIGKIDYWARSNQDGLHHSMKNKDRVNHALRQVDKYFVHFESCKEDVSLYFTATEEVRCNKCKAIWKYNLSKRTLEINSFLYNETKFVKDALLLYEKRIQVIKTCMRMTEPYVRLYQKLNEDKLLQLKNRLEKLKEKHEAEGISFFSNRRLENDINCLVRCYRFMKYHRNENLLECLSVKEIENRKNETVKGLLKNSYTEEEVENEFNRQVGKIEEVEKEYENHCESLLAKLTTSYQLTENTYELKEVCVCLDVIQRLKGKYGKNVISMLLKEAYSEYGYLIEQEDNDLMGSLKHMKLVTIYKLFFELEEMGWIESNDLTKKQKEATIQLTEKGERLFVLLTKRMERLRGAKNLKKTFMEVPFDTYTSYLSLSIVCENWKKEYLNVNFKKDGFQLYKNLLQWCKQNDSEHHSFIFNFLSNHYEERYRPIYEFYARIEEKGAFTKFVNNMLILHQNKKEKRQLHGENVS